MFHCVFSNILVKIKKIKSMGFIFSRRMASPIKLSSLHYSTTEHRMAISVRPKGSSLLCSHCPATRHPDTLPLAPAAPHPDLQHPWGARAFSMKCDEFSAVWETFLLVFLKTEHSRVNENSCRISPCTPPVKGLIVTQGSTEDCE